MKTKTKTKLFILASIFIGSMLFLAFTLKQQPQSWVVPAKFKNMKNPVTANKQNLNVGKSMYNKHCKSCHGTVGKGDGSKAGQLKSSCGDFASKTFKTQTDGSLFFKITEGKGEMPAYKNKISEDEDRWIIINYIRTF